MDFLYDRLTKCDSGLTLNPLMHLFIFLTFVFSITFLFPSLAAGITSSVLFIETAKVSTFFVNTWGVVGILTIILHFAGFLIRGKWGSRLIEAAAFCGFFMWLWASVIYLGAGFAFQFFVGAVPNLGFWLWYAWQWRRRATNKRVAFV